MDHDDMGSHWMDPDGPEPQGLDPQGLDPDGLEPDGMVAGGPEPGLDGADHAAWPDDIPDHHHHLLEPDPSGADPADLSFAEDYHDLGEDYHLGGDPIAGGDLPDLPEVAGAADPVFGVDPDLHPLADAGFGEDPAFPPMLDLDPPEPVDGHPWADPAALGHETLPALDGATGGPEPADLFGYAGEWPPADGAGWPALLASADPATSALARWWSAPD